jgi:tetratricopeptide (TPR) repeat protein
MLIETLLLWTLAAAQVPPSPTPAPQSAPSPPQSSAPPSAPTPAPAAAPAPSSASPTPAASSDDPLPTGPQSHTAAQAEAAVAPADAAYKEYGTHDIATVLGTRRGADGKDKHFLAMPVVDAISADLAAHALRYPPSFRTTEERQRAENDAQRLAGVIETVTKRDPTQKDDVSSELLLKLAMLEAIGSNLDLPGSAGHAVATFERLLAREPDNRWANYHYGVFLAGTATLQGKAEPYLKKALALGINDAHFSLAMLHVSLGDDAAAMQDFEAWLKLHPDDEAAKKLVEAIKAGHVTHPAPAAPANPGPP